MSRAPLDKSIGVDANDPAVLQEASKGIGEASGELDDSQLDAVAGGVRTPTPPPAPSRNQAPTPGATDGSFTRTDGTTGLASDVNFGQA